MGGSRERTPRSRISWTEDRAMLGGLHLARTALLVAARWDRVAPLEVIVPAALISRLGATLTGTEVLGHAAELARPDPAYRFKRVWRDGSVAVEFDPIDFVGKLAALVPRPHSNLVRYHGCMAAHASIRAYVVKNGRGPPPSKAEVAAMVASGVDAASFFDRRLAVPVPQLWRPDEGDRRDHRQACGEQDARAPRFCERCARAVADPWTTGVGRVGAVARRRAAGDARRQHLAGRRVARDEHRDRGVRFEIASRIPETPQMLQRVYRARQIGGSHVAEADSEGAVAPRERRERAL